MNCDDEEMPDTQPCDDWTQSQSQSQDVNSQSANVWGNLIPSIQSSKWGITFPLIQLTKDVYKVGRGKDCDIELSSPYHIHNEHLKVISKVHFLIIRQVISKKNDVVIYLEDSSQNGTFINKKLIGKGNRHVLDNDDVISLSRSHLKVWKFISLNVYETNILPRELGVNYVVLRTLGSGVCGEVKMIYSKLQHKAFAIKTILKQVSTVKNVENPLTNFGRLMNEVRILKALDNPFIIKMEDIVDTPSKLYIILELMEGGELFDRVSSKMGLPERQTKFIFYQLVKAVNYLHSQGITHRDLKPENILLASDADYPLVKITDFGMSKLVDTKTLMKTFCGTPLYVAPEIIKTGGHGAYTNLVDVWSLGVILYVTLSGTIPFSSERTNVSLGNQILNGMYCFPRNKFEHISTEAIDLIKGMMTVDPSLRKTIRQVMFHPWLLDRQIKFEVEKMITYNNENSSPSDEENINIEDGQKSEARKNSSTKTLQLFGMVGHLAKRRRKE